MSNPHVRMAPARATTADGQLGPTVPDPGSEIPEASTGVIPALVELPPVLDLVAAAGLLGIGRTTAYQLVRTGTWPTRVLRVGKMIRIPTADVLVLLGTPAPVGAIRLST